MAFQSTVNYQFSAGNLGEIIQSGPTRAQSFRLNSQTTNPNIIGLAYTYAADATPQGGNPGSMVCQVGGTGAFAGILVMPKDYALYGTTGNTLGATITMPANSQVQLMTMGIIVCQFTTAVSYGDPVYFATDNTNGDVVGGLYKTTAANRVLIPNARIISTTSAPSGTNPGYAQVQFTQ
jgi:hypothetical protein